MLEVAGRKVADTLEEIVDPKSSALLLWDMEYAIAPNAFNFNEITPRLKDLAASARKAGVPVFYSQQIPYGLEREEADVWVRVRSRRAGSASREIPAGKSGHDIIEELSPRAEDILFHKRRPDGFIGTDLDLMLRNRNVKTVIIGGVATEGGVEGTARTGRNLGYYMVITKDGVGSRNRDLHEAALKLMQGAHFDIASVAEIAGIWTRKS